MTDSGLVEKRRRYNIKMRALGRYITGNVDNSIEAEDYRELELFIREITDGNW